jgi:hypothetical protein
MRAGGQQLIDASERFPTRGAFSSDCGHETTFNLSTSPLIFIMTFGSGILTFSILLFHSLPRASLHLGDLEHAISDRQI